MALSVAIQMDPIERIDIAGDSTFALALEAQARGHSLLYYGPRDLTFRDGAVTARVRSSSPNATQSWVKTTSLRTSAPSIVAIPRASCPAAATSPSISSTTPPRPSDRRAAHTGTPR